jgi:hypothetical protein
VIRSDIGALDIVMMIKGVCEAGIALQHVDPSIADRQMDLVRAAISSDPAAMPLRGRAPTLADLERAAPKGDAPALAKPA